MNDHPIADADLASRTPWFWRDDKPIRVGWYECRYWSGCYRRWSSDVFRWWDGHAFRFGPGADDVASDFGFHPNDQWRGKVAP